MELTDRLFLEFNSQRTQELTNNLVYQQLQSCAENIAYDGFAKYFADAAKEELEHADAFRSFIIDRNRCPKILAQPAVSFDLKEPLDMVKAALAAEQANTKKILALYELCHTEKDSEAKVFLFPYLTEQRKAERELTDLVIRLERCGSVAAIMLIDLELKNGK